MATSLKLPVPVHIVTGGLGAGKTTFLQALLKSKPPGERWALVINEFGAVGIDQAVLQSAASDGAAVNVKELAGGCMCCTLSGVSSAPCSSAV
jgi:G3E family GTPase